MSPIFVRPVREQLEHDRLIRQLQAKYKRKYEVLVNMGDQQLAPVKSGALSVFPDLVLMSGRKIAGIVEVESAESVNNLEAMAQWVHFGRARTPFHLYVPVQAYDAARRLAAAHQVPIAELWTYRALGEQFDLVRAHHDPSIVSRAVISPELKAATPQPPKADAATTPKASPRSSSSAPRLTTPPKAKKTAAKKPAKKTPAKKKTSARKAPKTSKTAPAKKKRK